MATLSLWLVNLLPIPVLDGGQLLAVTLEMVFVVPPEYLDLDVLEGGQMEAIRWRWGMYNRGRWRRHIQMVVERATIVCVGLSVVLGVLSALRGG
jgi:S2P endopeptidase